MADAVVKRGDTEPNLTIALSDKNGPVDLTNAELIDVHMKIGADPLIVLAGLDIAGDPEDGIAMYDFEPGDTEITTGVYQVEAIVTSTSGDETTFPREGYRELKVEARLT